MAWRIDELDRGRDDGWTKLPRAAERVGSWPQVLARVDDDFVVAHGGVVARVDAGGQPRWSHTCAGIPDDAYVSGDRVLVTTRSLEYHAWGYLGPALLLDLGDGAPIAELRGRRGAALRGGRFVLGLEGYDDFDTWLHDRDGAQIGQWRSYGHYVVDPDDSVRVVECDRRNPTRSRVVRLRPGGSIERGPALRDSQAGRPVVLDDGTIVFVDAGTLRAVDRALDPGVLAELVAVPVGGEWRFYAELALDGARLSVAIAERSADAPVTYTTRRWTFAIARD